MTYDPYGTKPPGAGRPANPPQVFSFNLQPSATAPAGQSAAAAAGASRNRSTPARAAGGSGGSSNPLIDMMLGLLGQGGSGGSYSAGYNGDPARAAARSAYDSQLGNAKNVYGQINTQIKDRAPLIQQGYERATATVNADAQQRAAADAARGAEADLRNQQTAAALGLNVVPQSTQADALQQAGQNAYQSNAQAWTGFNNASAQTAGERNTATGDAFTYAGTQAEQSLAAMLQQALSNISAQEASNPGGYSGGSSSAGTDLKILQTLMGYDTDQQKLAAESAGKANPLASISPAGWQGIQSAYASTPSLGYGTAQANSLALKQLANNPRDFATLYSALTGG